MKAKKLHAFFLIAVFLIAFLLRFYKLGEIPSGLYQDETAIGYNAYSILETGKDERGQQFPIYFKSFGDYKLPVYIYTTIIPIKLFGLNEFAVRFPSAFFGFLTVPVFYFLVKELTRDKKLALVATILLAVNPWHLHYSRAAFEVSISLFLFLSGFYLLHQASFFKRRGLFLLGTIAFIIGLYTYNLTRLFAPLLYLVTIWFFRKNLTNLAKKEIILTAVCSIVLLIPFLTTLVENGGISSAQGTIISTSAAVQAPLLELRSYLIDLPQSFVKPFFNMTALTLWQYLSNIASYLSVPFFFIFGSSHGNHGIGNVGQFYLFELPLIILGLYKIVKNRPPWGIFLMLWTIITVLVAALTREVPHATRSFFLIPSMIVFSALGVLTILGWRKRLAMVVLAVFTIYNLIYYFTSYYARFPVFYAKSWRSQDKNLSLYLKENEDKYDRIVFDKRAGFIYTSLIFYQQFNPDEFQKEAVYDSADSENFSFLSRVGKYEFRDIDWLTDLKFKNSLIITGSNYQPANAPAIKTFSYPKRPIVISIKQEILQYPVEEVAYVVIETEK